MVGSEQIGAVHQIDALSPQLSGHGKRSPQVVRRMSVARYGRFVGRARHAGGAEKFGHGFRFGKMEGHAREAGGVHRLRDAQRRVLGSAHRGKWQDVRDFLHRVTSTT